MSDEEDNRKLMTEFVKASNEIHKKTKRGKASYVEMSAEILKELADEAGVSTEEMARRIQRSIDEA